jgi:PAS domain S-box-containing protein
MPTKPQPGPTLLSDVTGDSIAGNGLRKSGIELLGDIPWGTHFCQFYETPDDLIEILVPYFREGLKQNEFCMWVTSEPLDATEAKAALNRVMPDLERFIRQGQIEILNYRQWYTASGKFDANRVLQGWVDKENSALRQGYQGLRLTGNTFWLEKSDWNDFAEYEATVDSVIKSHHMIAICTYAVGRCNAGEVIDVVNNHQFALMKRSGRWEMMESRQRRIAEEQIQRLNRELEERVRRRTEELRAVNESLQAEIAQRIKSEEVTSRLAAIVESSEDAIIGKSLDGIITSWNQAAERIYGYAASEMMGKSVETLISPGRPDEMTLILEKIRRGQRVEHYETVRIGKSGEPLAVSLTVSPIKDRSGRVTGAGTIARDITQHKQLEKELHTASSYARSLIEASLDPLVTISALGKIMDVNKATEQATGVPRDQLIGTYFSDYFTDSARAREGYQRVLSEGFVRDYSLTIQHVSGKTTDVLYNATVYRSEMGQVQGIFAAARDITEHKRMEDELRAASLYARSLIEASLDPLVTISPEGKITDVNMATELATGVTRDHLIGSDFSIYFMEPDRASQGYRQVLTQGPVRDYALTIRHASGKTMDVLYNAAVYKNDSGALQGVFAAARDITDRKAAERRQTVTNSLLELFALKNTRKEYLHSVAEVIHDWSGCRCVGIRVIDGQSNMPYESLIGFTRKFREQENGLCAERDSCICSRAVLGAPGPQDAPILTSAGSYRVDNTFEFFNGLPAQYKTRFRGICLTSGFASLAVIPIRYRGETLGLVHLADEREGMVPAGSVQFIESMAPLIGEAIHRFNAESELSKHRDHLEELVQRRTDELQSMAQNLARSNKDLEQFAYVASHDLQEPLRAVAGFVGLLQRRYEEKLDAKADSYIAAAVEGAARMQSLIADLLEYSRVDTQGHTLESIEAATALNDALINLAASIRETGAGIIVDQLPAVTADRIQLTQLFQNLVGNAIKFRGDRPPEIQIRAKREQDSWLFSVQDNGIGIEREFTDKIFLIFQRLQTRDKYPGTGIGLAICKKIVERHGGRIWVESEPGQGSTFYFSISNCGELL